MERLRGGHRLSRAYVDRTKLTDHHAIIPTGQQPAPNLAPDLQKVYDLVVARFVGIFLPDQQVEETTVLLDIGGADFVAKGSVVLEVGWTVVSQYGLQTLQRVKRRKKKTSGRFRRCNKVSKFT